MNDAKDADGATVLLRPAGRAAALGPDSADPSGQGSLVELSGAVVPKRDSARGAAVVLSRSAGCYAGSSISSNRSIRG